MAACHTHAHTDTYTHFHYSGRTTAKRVATPENYFGVKLA